MRALLVFFFLFGYVYAQKTNIIVISIDTLRHDHVSGYGYERQTTPNLDRLMAGGKRFESARTVEPLTAPAMATMLTGLYPHEHGISRNGLALFKDLDSLPKTLHEHGYQTAAFVSNWTLKARLSGLGEHYEKYEGIFTRKRWLGLFLDEADAQDLSDAAIDYLENVSHDKPFFLWLHYVDPHEPYRFHEEYAAQVGVSEGDSKVNRYDTEIAYNDAQVQRVLDTLYATFDQENVMVVFTSDHGESFGEHGYWGHGRHVFEPTLRIPLSITWPAKIKPGLVSGDALLLDIPRTLLALVGIQAPSSMSGYDWSPSLLRDEPGPTSRTTFYQAHRGAVQKVQNAQRGREKGLLEVAVLKDGVKERYEIRDGDRTVFDLKTDPGETKSTVGKESSISEILRKWTLDVDRGLNRIMVNNPELNDEDWEMLRSLGYVE